MNMSKHWFIGCRNTQNCLINATKIEIYPIEAKSLGPEGKRARTVKWIDAVDVVNGVLGPPDTGFKNRALVV